MITFEQANEMFSYQPETGDISYKKDASIRHKTKGKIATFEHYAGNNYTRLKIQYKGKHYQAHRIAWLLFYGEHPENVIDHINGDPLDNRILNLRDVTRGENQLNRVRGTALQKNNQSGVAGLYYIKEQGMWRAKSFSGGGMKHLGYFDNKFDACCAIFSERRGFLPAIIPEGVRIAGRPYC